MNYYIAIRNEEDFTSTVKYSSETIELSLVGETLQGGLEIGY
jgi:hypothetical protein